MIILSIRIDIVWRSHRSHSSASASLLSFDHLQMPAMAGLISNRVGMTALYGLLRILLCYEFVPPPNLLFFTLVFVLPRPPPFFAGSELPSSIIFFLVRKFLSDIWSGRLAFFVGHFEKMSDCPTSPTNFDSTVNEFNCQFTVYRKVQTMKLGRQDPRIQHFPTRCQKARATRPRWTTVWLTCRQTLVRDPVSLATLYMLWWNAKIL